MSSWLNTLRGYLRSGSDAMHSVKQMEATSREALKHFDRAFGNPHPEHNTLHSIACIAQTMASDYCNKYLYQNKKYTDSKRVTHYEQRVYSVKCEDGIIEEIFNRIGVTNRTFAEFGVSWRGYENNSLYLLLKGWNGLWIEGNPLIHSKDEDATGSTLYHFRNVVQAREKYIGEGRLKILNRYVTAENIEQLFDEVKLSAEFDFLSIDIDGNDYWVWKAIQKYNPRVVCMEYNSILGATASCTVPYDPAWQWDGSYYFGASLAALEKLGREKGYSLVGCDFTGINAYFVRNDLLGDLFEAPYTSANHFEPNRYFLTTNPGNWMSPGPFVEI